MNINYSAYSARSHHLNQCWNIINWTISDNFHSNQNTTVFIHENTFEHVVRKMLANLSRPQPPLSCISDNKVIVVSILVVTDKTTLYHISYTMTSSNGNIFRVTGHLCGNSPVPSEFPTQRPVTRSFDVYFDLRPNNGWVNKCEAGDLRRHCAHYDVIVMHYGIGKLTSTCIFLRFIICKRHHIAQQRILTHWGRATHICVGNLTIIGSDNGLPPGRRQAIIWTNAGILSIGPFETNFNEIFIGIQTFSVKKMHFKMSSAKWRPFSLDLNVLTYMYPPLCIYGHIFLDEHIFIKLYQQFLFTATIIS